MIIILPDCPNDLIKLRVLPKRNLLHITSSATVNNTKERTRVLARFLRASNLGISPEALKESKPTFFAANKIVFGSSIENSFGK